MLKPFWRYYGGKWRAAPRYPPPVHAHIIEPFAGAAGYSLRYPARNVILIEKYPIVAGIWRYLIRVSPEEVLRIPCVEHVEDLPAWVPEEARWLVGFTLNAGTVRPCRQLSKGRRQMRARGCKFEGWSIAQRARVARQVNAIRHWTLIEGDYSQAPDIVGTWFVDPPYDNVAGSHYVHAALDRADLAHWCMARRGQVIVCENEGATYLPFERFATLKPGLNGKGSREVVWTKGCPTQLEIWK